MIFFPGVLNIVYFWITDSYLKAGKEHLDDDEVEISPVHVGETVTPYSQMGAGDDELNGGLHASSYNGGDESKGTAPQAGTLV